MRVLLVSLLAVFAVSAVASSSAFAAQEYFTCNAKAGGKYNTKLCNEKKAGVEEFELEKIPAAGKFEVTSSNTIGGYKHPAILEGQIGTLRVIVQCATVTDTGELEAAGASKGEVKFTECEIFQVVNRIKDPLTVCTVQPITFNFKDQLIAGKGIGNEDEFKPAAGGTLFVEIELTGALCPLPRLNKVEVTAAGLGVTAYIIEPNVSEETHVVVFTGTGSQNLRFATNKASFYAVIIIKSKNGHGWTAE